MMSWVDGTDQSSGAISQNQSQTSIQPQTSSKSILQVQQSIISSRDQESFNKLNTTTTSTNSENKSASLREKEGIKFEESVVNPSVSPSSPSSSPSPDPLLHIDQYSSNILIQDSSSLKSQEESHLLQDNQSSASSSGQFMELQSIHPVIKSFLIGSVSGTCSTLLFQPLDLLKTRMQTPNFRPIPGATSHPGGFLTIVGHIVRDEKLLGLWRGITPSLTRCVPGVGLYFATIHGLKLTFDIHGEPTAFQSLALGVTGRSFSGVLMIPFTVIKTRYESKVYQYGSIRQALGSIYRQEGVRGLTCGLIPTLLRDAPFSGIYLLIYTSTKKGVGKEWMESPTLGPYVRFSCGVVAGIGASLITQPADVIKTKMQLYPDKFQSVRQVLPYVYKKYGVTGYFKGLMPRMIRRTLIAAMSWTVYEQLIHSLGLK